MSKIMVRFSIYLFLMLGATYVHAGCISGNCYNGKGTFLFNDGSKYIGTFLNSKPHGKGIYVHKDKSVYNGDFYKGVKHGLGKMTYQSKEVFIGNFENGVINGKGKMTYKNGDIYVGDWVNGKSSGDGIYTFADGDIYEGNFLDGQFEGQGKLSRTNGSYYEGEWLRSKKNGKGISFSNGKLKTQYYELNQLISEENYDEYSDSKENPQNSNVILDCNSIVCHQTKGRFRYGDGSIYTGDFINGEGQGQGICLYANGDSYEGGWKNHAPHGKGTMYFSKGNVYSAVWENGVPTQKLQPEVKSEIVKTKTETSKQELGKTNIYALVVGVATYNHMPSLKYTDDDAYQLYAFLKSPEGGAIPDDHIKILIDDAATHTTIMQELKNIAQLADANDVIMLYLSGHGLDGAYVPSDFDGYKYQIPYGDILDVLNNSSARHKLFITDACHSGSMIASARTPLNVALENFYSAYNTINGGTAIMMSSKKEEVSLEYGGLRQGIFSHYLIKGLKGNADEDHNKIITITELYNYVSSNVKAYTAKAQNPVIMGDFDKEMPVGLIR